MNIRLILCILKIMLCNTIFAQHLPYLEIVSTSESDCTENGNNVIIQVKNHPTIKGNHSIPQEKSKVSVDDNFNYQICNTSSYGELADLLGDNLLTVDSITINGPVGLADFETMWRASFDGNLKVINLENADIENLSVPDYAFYHPYEQLSPDGQYIYCILLTKIILPDNIKCIGESSFSYAINLEHINIPSSLEEIGEYAFADCISLKTDPLIFPDGLQEIPNMCFLNCESLTGSVVMPKTLKAIGAGAFFQAKIKSITLNEGLETLGQAAFYACNLENVVLPESCQNLQGTSHFQLCKDLKDVYLPEGLQQIPSSFVSACLSLENINIPTTIKSINLRALWQCRSIKHLHLPEGLESIEAYALWYLDALEEIEFPSTLTYLGEESCEYWANIKQIYSKSDIPPICIQSSLNIGSTPFGKPDSEFYMRTPQTTPVYVPIGTADAYSNSEGWNYFVNFIETEDFPYSGVMEVALEERPKDNAIYDIMGRKVTNMQKGSFYIKDGKKFIFQE